MHGFAEKNKGVIVLLCVREAGKTSAGTLHKICLRA